MFQFPGLAFVTYVFSNKYLLIDLYYSKEMFVRTNIKSPARLCIQLTILRNNRDRRWVAPFGNPRIKARSQLPKAYRSVPRPSSPLSAKASTECPYDT